MAAQYPRSARRRLFRSRRDLWFSGVCGGLGEYFGINAGLIRVAFVVSALVSGGSASPHTSSHGSSSPASLDTESGETRRGSRGPSKYRHRGSVPRYCVRAPTHSGGRRHTRAGLGRGGGAGRRRGRSRHGPRWSRALAYRARRTRPRHDRTARHTELQPDGGRSHRAAGIAAGTDRWLLECLRHDDHRPHGAGHRCGEPDRTRHFRIRRRHRHRPARDRGSR